MQGGLSTFFSFIMLLIARKIFSCGILCHKNVCIRKTKKTIFEHSNFLIETKKNCLDLNYLIHVLVNKIPYKLCYKRIKYCNENIFA